MRHNDLTPKILHTRGTLDHFDWGWTTQGPKAWYHSPCYSVNGYRMYSYEEQDIVFWDIDELMTLVLRGVNYDGTNERMMWALWDEYFTEHKEDRWFEEDLENLSLRCRVYKV